MATTVTFAFTKDLRIGPATSSYFLRLITTGASWGYRFYGTDTLSSGLLTLDKQTQVPSGTLTNLPFAPYVVVNQTYCP